MQYRIPVFRRYKYRFSVFAVSLIKTSHHLYIHAVKVDVLHSSIFQRQNSNNMLTDSDGEMEVQIVKETLQNQLLLLVCNLKMLILKWISLLSCKRRSQNHWRLQSQDLSSVLATERPSAAEQSGKRVHFMELVTFDHSFRQFQLNPSPRFPSATACLRTKLSDRSLDALNFLH